VQEVGVPLPKSVQAEFKKRISAASSSGSSSKTKPKLNFSSCELNDAQVLFVFLNFLQSLLSNIDKFL
jgi:hypothetical protein